MPVNPGTRFGPYEIVSPIGAGGMGQVYRARDTRLGREVALKILPPEMSGDSARRGRFEQEARAAAALNHPNITGLHDVGEEQGVSYIVTELIVGETLELVIERGPVPVKKLLDIAVQVADGMASAHAARIAHRDLKPANLMITTDGRVKILDFGLAKQAGPSRSEETVTEPGMILGTVAYMSPEQARGKPADYRSDQFSFGLILYEMAAGRKAFERPESVQVMSAILSEEAPPIERDIPAPLRWAIERCLAKDPADRYESTRDLFQQLRQMRDHLSEASSVSSGVRAAVPVPAPARKFPWAIPAAFVCGAVMVGAVAFVMSGPKLPDQMAYRFTPFSFESGGQYSPVWSPNGKAVAYAARPQEGMPAQVFVRYLDSATPVQITRAAESSQPLGWAPDSARIFFGSDREPAGIWSIAAVGGEPEPVMALGHGTPLSISPDGKSVAMLRRAGESTYGLWVSSPPNAPPKRYLPEPFATQTVYNEPRVRFSPDGRSILIYIHGDRHVEEAWLMPYPADPARPPKRVLESIPTFGGTPNVSWMPDSRNVLLALAPTGTASQIWIADTRSQKRTSIIASTASYIGAAASPDGRRLILADYVGNYNVVSMDLATAKVTPLIDTSRNENLPAWAAKKDLLVYATSRNGPQELWLRESDGTSRPVVTPRDFPEGTTQWFMGPALSPDGTRVVYSRLERNGGSKIWISSVSGGAPIRLTNDDGATEFSGDFSPDGAWLVYQAIRNGKKSLMKVKVSGQASPTLLKENVQGEVAVWSPTGEWILANDDLISPDGQTVRSMGEHFTDAYAFSQDGKRLYGLRSAGERLVLFSLDIATKAEKVIGETSRDFAPTSNLHPGVRLSMTPDGKSITYAAGKFLTNLWMLEGFAQ